MPKSVRNACSLPARSATRTLAGLTSRWTSPRRCASASAPAIWETMRTARAGSSRVSSRQQRAQVGALDEAHREVERAALGAGVEDRDDVRVVERGRQPALALEAGAEDRVARERGREHLQRDRAVERQVGGPVDDAHPAAPGDRVDAVAGEGRADGQLVAAGIGRDGGEAGAERGVDVGAAGGGGAHRVDELVVRGLLEHEAARAAAQRGARELGVVVLRHARPRRRPAPPRAGRGSRAGSAGRAC